MSKLKKWTAVLLTAVMIGTLLGGSMGPAVAKAENEAAQSETADDTKKEAGEESSGEAAESVSEADQEEAPGTVSQKDGTGEADQTPSDQTLVQQEQKEQEEEAASQESGAKTVGESQKEELKEAENRQESETSGMTVELKGISVKEDISLDQIATPETFTVEIMMDAPEDFAVYQMEIGYWSEENGRSLQYSKEYSDISWIPSEGGAGEIEVTLNKYVPEGKYTLESIFISGTSDYDQVYASYYYDSELKKMVLGYQDSIEGIVFAEEFSYQGAADFQVTDSSQQDLSYPEITKVSLASEAPINSGDTVELAVDYSESGSGIKTIEILYAESGADTEEDVMYGSVIWYLDDLEEGAYIGEGTLKIERDTQDMAGEYELYSIRIEDYTGNVTNYSTPEEIEANGVDTTGAEILDIQCIESNGLKVKDLRIEGVADKNNLATGDSFDVVVTVYNDIEKQVPVVPERCWVQWGGDGRDSDYEKVYSEGESFTLNPGAEAQLRFPVKVSEYSGTAEYNLSLLSINGSEINNNFWPATYYDKRWSDNLMGTGSTAADHFRSGIMDVLSYNGEIDWAVTTPTSKPDNEAPIIESVTVNPSSLTIPGKLELEIRTSGEEVSPINSLSWTFLDKERKKNAIMGMSTNPEDFKDDEDMYASYRDYYYSPLSYSEEKQCYIAEVELDEKVIEGIYYLSDISLRDEAGNTIRYGYINNLGKLQGSPITNGDVVGDSVYLDTCEFTVTESAAPDEDFEGPIFKDIELLENQAEAGGVVQCRIKVGDETGLSEVSLCYGSDMDQDGETDTFVYLKSRNVILQGEDYICDFVIDPYFLEGNYDFCDVVLTDGSIRRNMSYYVYDKLANAVFDGYDVIQLPAGRDLSLSVTQTQENMVVADLTDGNVIKAAEEAKAGGTIVVKGSYLEENSYARFPSEFFEVAKEKNLTVIIPDSLGDSELVIKGEELTQIPNMDPELRIQREGLVEDTAGVGDDNLYYPVNVVTSDAALPITVRVKIEKNFLDQCGDNPIRISKVDESGTPAVIAENVTVGEDGYVEISFPNGLQGTGVASQVLYTNSGGQRLLQEKYSFMISSQKEEAEVKLGDVNGDGEINIFDLTLCMNHIVEKKALEGEALAGADVNKDGEVNIFDLTKVMNYIVEKTTAL